MMYPYRRMVAEERRMLDASLDFIYDAFVDGVAKGRGLPVARVRDLAQGRVYLGSQAVDLGLVDGVKGLNEVIEIAADTAGIKDDYRVLSFRPGKAGFVQRALRSAGQLSELLLGPGLDAEEDTHISAEILD